MNIVVAMDSFKGSVTSLEAGQAVKEGIRKAGIEAKIEISPLADGGEGTVEALTFGMGGSLKEVEVTGPLGKKVTAHYGILDDGKTCVMEMAQAAGLPLILEEERNPFYTTTYGVGEMILHAIKEGCRKFIIGIGGSATNDGGAGMLQALGYGLLDEKGQEIAFGAKGLEHIAKIVDNSEEILAQCEFFVACDVTNPLCGPNGCSEVFAPQKGATKKMVEKMDCWLKNYSQIVKNKYPEANPDFAGAGAAGGLGFAFATCLNASLVSGGNLVIDVTKLEEKIQQADLVFTGEGQMDGQTAMGKAPIGVAKLAAKYQVPVFAVAGGLKKGVEHCHEAGINAYFSIIPKYSNLENLMEKEVTKTNITNTVEQIMRVWKIKK